MRLAALALCLVLPSAPLAAGGHDRVGCLGCHAMHAGRGGPGFAIAPNEKLLDPRTGKPHGSVTAVCLACHADPQDGGRGVASVSGHFPHPFSRAKVDPRLAQVPAALLRDGRFECVGCHDPHPSNPNYRYLRIAVKETPRLSELCTVCHPRKAERAGDARADSPAATARAELADLGDRAAR